MSESRASALLQAPAELIALAGQARDHAVAGQTPLVELDKPENKTRAIEWLEAHAPEALSGAGGNNTSYWVACRVKDYGISEPLIAELLRDYWNERNEPAWDWEELQQFAENAYIYGKRAPGAALAEDFSVADLSQGATERERTAILSATPYSGCELASIPPRKWIVPGFLARTFVTGLISPPGMGKTQLIANLCIAIPRGGEKPIGRRICEATSVWYWNQEDDAVELDRRIAAARKHFGVDAVSGLFVNSGVGIPLSLVKRQGGRLTETPHVAAIIEEIRARSIGVFIVDPLQEIHEANENDNPEMRIVWSALRRIAVEGDCAVLVAAHTRKPPQATSDGFAGDADSLRGASSQVGVLRLAHTLHNMSTRDAKAHGIAEAERHLYLRFDDAKSNLHLKDGQPRWLKRMSVPGANVDETIGVLEPVRLESRSSLDLLHVIAKTLADNKELGRGQFHALSDILEHMPVGERAAFGPSKHRFRALNKTLGDHGLSTDANVRQSTNTEYGTLEIIKKKGRDGICFLLADRNSPTLQPGLQNGAFGDVDEMFE